MQRREFIAGLGSAVGAWPLAVRAQQSPLPVIGFLSGRSPTESAAVEAAFRAGLGEAGYIEGRNLHIAFRWAEGQYDRLPELAENLIAQQVAVIAAVAGGVFAAKARYNEHPDRVRDGGGRCRQNRLGREHEPAGRQRDRHHSDHLGARPQAA
jgi:putative ABC transport system substrate-binding protein